MNEQSGPEAVSGVQPAGEGDVAPTKPEPTAEPPVDDPAQAGADQVPAAPDGPEAEEPATQPSAAPPSAAETVPPESEGRSDGRRARRAKRPRKHRPLWVEIPVLLLISFTLTFLIQTFIAKVYYVPSGSMEQTLHGVQSGGDRILVSKIVYDFRDPHQGDVVVFNGNEKWAPEVQLAEPGNWFSKFLGQVGSVVGIAPPDEKDFVKRVIAVGGQTVACCDAKGNVTVDGRSLNEPYIYEPIPFTDCGVSTDGTRYNSQRCFGPYKVPDGQVWVMGDHRSESADSSYECRGYVPSGPDAIQACRGPIPVGNVIGKAIFIVMPPSRWGSIGDPVIDPGNPQLGAAATSVLPAAGGVLLTLGLRGGWAMTPANRRRRRIRRARPRPRP